MAEAPGFSGSPGREWLQAVAAPEDSRLPMPRTLVLVAHPDDEVIALAARLRRYRNALFVHATDGAPEDGADAAAHGFRSLEAYRLARREELQGALRLAGVDGARTVALGFVDQQAPHHLGALTAAVHRLLVEHAPAVLLTHPYEGGHPDHDACAFAAQAACRMLGASRPVIVEAAFYHQGPHGIETGCFLPHVSHADADTVVCQLSAAEQARRAALFACFPSQAETLRWFRRDLESFRLAPDYEFSQPPYPGKLFYEGFGWGMTGGRFCALAQEALLQPAREPAACR